MLLFLEWRDSHAASVCPFTTLAVSATMGPCAFTNESLGLSWNAAVSGPPSLEIVIWNADDHALAAPPA